MPASDDTSSPGVLIACHSHFREQIGGAFKIATELAEHLVLQGRRVFYVCGTNEHCPSNPTNVNGVELWRYTFPMATSPHPGNLIGHVLGTYRLTREILKRSPVECMNGHSPLQFLGASLAARKSCRRQIYTVHSPFAEEVERNHANGRVSLRQRMMRKVAKTIEGMNCRRASVVHCLSRFTAGRLAEVFGRCVENKTVVAPGWVNVERFHAVESIAATRATLGPAWRTERPIFFTVRRLEARMGLEQLIEAAKVLLEQGFQFRVSIGGAGSLEQDLKRQVHQSGLGDTVHLLGRVSDEDLPRCFAAADCFVLPTRALECFGLIVLEAYACGTPVIGTPVGAIPELIGEAGEQWLTAGTSSQEIADRMAAFLRKELIGDRDGLRLLAERWRAEHGLERLSNVLLNGSKVPCIG